jgi:hypothetical protein
MPAQELLSESRRRDMAEAKRTQNRNEVRKWAEQRGGHPATVKETAHTGEDAGILRIDFDDGEPDDSLERIDWESFFDKFDAENLTFLYQEKTAEGDVSRFCKFVESEAT